MKRFKGRIKAKISTIPIKFLLVVPFTLQILVTVGLVGYFSYRSGQQAVEKLAGRLMEKVGDQIIQNIEYYVQLPDYITQSNAQLINSGMLDGTNIDAMEKYFVEQINIFPNMSSIYIATNDSQFRVVAKIEADSLLIRDWEESTGNFNNYVADLQGNRLYLKNVIPNYDLYNDPPDRPWYKRAISAPDGLWIIVVSGVKGMESRILVLVRSLPFKDRDGTVKGVLGAALFLDQMGDFLKELKISQNGQYFIMDKAGFLIATSTGEAPFMRGKKLGVNVENNDPQQRRLHVRYSEDLLTRFAGNLAIKNFIEAGIKTPQNSDFKKNHKSYFIRFIPLSIFPELDWVVVIVVPRSDFMSEINENRNRTFMFCFLAFLGATLIGKRTAEEIIRPLEKLNENIKKIASKEIENHPLKTRIRELHEIENSFQKMAGRLDASFRALKNSESKFSTVLNTIPVGISVFDVSGRLILLNQVGEAILGRGILEIPISQLSEAYQIYIAGSDRLYPPDYLPVVRALRGETVCRQDIEIENNGRRIPLEIQSVPVFDESGQIIYAINAFQDVTERRKAEQLRVNYQRDLEGKVAEKTAALQENEIRLKEAQRIAHVGSWELDVGTKTSAWSEEMYRIAGRDPVSFDITYSNILNLLPLEDRDKLKKAVERAIADGTPYEVEHRILGLDGSVRHVVSRGEAIFDERGKVVKVRGTGADISGRKQAEIELQKAKEKAEANVEAKSGFIANMSHELRSPLNAILGFARLLMNDSELTSQQRENADLIYQSGNYLLTLINQVLDLAKLESGCTTVNPTIFNLENLLYELENLLSLQAQNKGLQLTFKIEPAVPITIRTDEMKLRQVLINLISNAIKFTETGWIEVRVAIASKIPPSTLKLSFAVEDTGPGISPAEQRHLFAAFMQTEVGRHSKSGTGLGLKISREFVQLMGGDIQVNSQPGVGSTFEFSILTTKIEPTFLSETLSSQPSLSLKPGQFNYRILVVDDNLPNRRLLVQFLAPFQVEIREAENGLEAIALWKQWQPQLIWMDLWMPVMDGYEATQIIREIEAEKSIDPVVIIAISAISFEPDDGDDAMAGFNEFIGKPFQEKSIFYVLNNYLKNLRYRDRNFSAISEKKAAIASISNLEEMMKNLTKSQIDDLEEALILGSTDGIKLVIQTFEDSHPELAKILLPMADHFKYLQLLNLIDLVR
ncbi:MAG: ATP-binding protein [Limnospira sp.]